MSRRRLVTLRPRRAWRPGKPGVVIALVLLSIAPRTAPAQLIAVKTVPLAQADQFAIFPSANLGMAGVSLALPDPLLDPFTNPAKGARIDDPRLVSTPGLMSVTRTDAGGRTLPVAALAKMGLWYGAASVALQGIDRNLSTFPTSGGLARSPAEPRPSIANAMTFASLGRTLPRGWSVAGSVFWARLKSVDGVDLLYAGSQGVREGGHALDLRIGVVKELPGDQIVEAIVLHNRFAMAYDVLFQDLTWDPGTQQLIPGQRVEHNRDRTNTWGLHTAYQRPLGDAGWRLGMIGTVNRLFHPDIPNYEVTNAGIVNIPWDPGDTYAYNLGIGVSRTLGPAVYGIDVVYEPIWSHTWGEAEEATVTRLGDTISIGGMTIENHFRFSNASLRMGLGYQFDRVVGMQLGLALRDYHYWLAQFDNVLVAGRNDEQQWVEWTPTWGLSLRFPELELRYQGYVTNGVGRPGARPAERVFLAGDAAAPTIAGTILATPAGPLDLPSVSVVTHRVSVSLPFGRPRAQGGGQ